MVTSSEYGGKPLDIKKSYAQLEAEVETLTERLEISEVVINELRDRLNDSFSKDIHDDKPRSPMCG